MNEIKLKKGGIAYVDDDDFDRVTKHTWYVERNGYIRTRVDGKLVSMHRFVMELKTGDAVDVDHINGKRNDNRKENLRTCTRSQNLANKPIGEKNTSGYKGVSWDKTRQKWQAKITYQGKQMHLGRFDDPEAAHTAYCAANDRLNGEFAHHGVVA